MYSVSIYTAVCMMISSVLQGCMWELQALVHFCLFCLGCLKHSSHRMCMQRRTYLKNLKD